MNVLLLQSESFKTGVVMDKYQEVFSDQDRYDDGIVVDYATMIRMWTTLDRSVAAFNRNCGVITLRPWQDSANANHGCKKGNSK